MTRYSDWAIIYKFLFSLIPIVITGGGIVAIIVLNITKTMEKDVFPIETNFVSLMKFSHKLIGEYREYTLGPEPEVLDEITEIKGVIEHSLIEIQKKTDGGNIYPEFQNDIERMAQVFIKISTLGDRLVTTRNNQKILQIQLEKEEGQGELILKGISNVPGSWVKFEQLSKHNVPVFLILNEIQRLFIITISETRDFIITKNDDTLSDLKRLQIDLNFHLKSLKEATQKDLTLQPIFATVEKTVKSLITTSNEAVEISEQIQNAMSELEEVENNIDNYFSSITGNLQVFISDYSGKSRLLVLLTIFAVLATCILAIILTSRYISTSLTTVIEITSRFGRGELDARAAIEGKDEIGALATTFNNMADNLVNNINTRQRMEEQLRHLQKMEIVGQMAGGIAHYFNNLFQVTSGYVKLILADSELPERIQSKLRHIENSTTEAANLTNKILVFSQQGLAYTTLLDLNELIADQKNITKDIFDQNIAVEITLLEKSTEISGNKQSLNQVFHHLFTNAKDAMPQGGRIMVHCQLIEAEPKFLEQHAWAQEGQYALVTVSDSGCGMTPEIQEKIFNPFFTTKEVGEGMGLGLSMAYGIIQQHNGMIEVESRPDSGAIFYIYLPINTPLSQSNTSKINM